jgi:hypothetical protein
MSEPEIIPPSPHKDDPSEALWREMMRQHAVRMRIMREEYDRENPPSRYDSRPLSWFDRWSVPLGLVFAIVVGIIVGFIASLPPRPIHVVVEQGSTP